VYDLLGELNTSSEVVRADAYSKVNLNLLSAKDRSSDWVGTRYISIDGLFD